MVDVSLAPSRRALVALYPYLVPVSRHAGWFAVFLTLATAIGPRGYGLFVVALSGVAIVEALFVGAVSKALADARPLEERHWSTALVTVIAGGAALWATLYALTRPFGALFGEAASGDLLQSLAILPLLGGLAAVPAAALRREGREAPSLAASVAGFVAGSGVAISLAWSGAGPWSLAAQIIVARLVECVVLWGIPGERVGIAWSYRHFAELIGAVRWRALAAGDGRTLFYAANLIIGLVLGPTAAGLYLLAAWPAEALVDIGLAAAASERPRGGLRCIWQMALPMVLASTLMAIVLPALVDLRWWGAVAPAQLLVLGALPLAMCRLPALDDSRRRLLRIFGGLAIVAVTVRYGLTAMAGMSVAWTMLCAIALLPAMRLKLGGEWRGARRDAMRPVAGALLAGVILAPLAGPVSLTLAAVPAFCLLAATGWLVYLIVRGEPAGAALSATTFAPAVAVPAPPEPGD